jgi:tRNA-intron endonuclease
MKTPSAQDQAELIGTRLIIWDYKSGLGIYRSGFFGKPVGIPKPKPDQDFEVPLLLDLMEGLYSSTNELASSTDAPRNQSERVSY